MADVGRPSDYTEEIAAEFCARLSEGQSVRTICLADDMPVASTVFLWLRRHPEFSEQYAKAKEASADALAEDLLDIADDGTNDWIEKRNQDGTTTEVLNGEHIQRSRLRVDTRKWLMARMQPKKYGERTMTEHSGAGGGPVITEVRNVIVRPDSPDS